MRHQNRERLYLLKKVDDNEVNFGETVPEHDDCAVGESHQLAHPKTAITEVQRAFQPVMVDLRRQFTPEALGSFKYTCTISDEYTTWTEINFLKTEDDALRALQSFVQSMGIPGSVQAE